MPGLESSKDLLPDAEIPQCCFRVEASIVVHQRLPRHIPSILQGVLGMQILLVSDILKGDHDLVLRFQVLGQRVLSNFQEPLALELAAGNPPFKASVLLIIDDLFHENS